MNFKKRETPHKRSSPEVVGSLYGVASLELDVGKFFGAECHDEVLANTMCELGSRIAVVHKVLDGKVKPGAERDELVIVDQGFFFGNVDAFAILIGFLYSGGFFFGLEDTN
ncbi:hypothetical protein HOI18_00720 [Candidatus Uhrbacteria bacterium]|jgi:hypothetical protein|nr:hypothetical protein [Candidatus Uhrbacteria bacterium]